MKLVIFLCIVFESLSNMSVHTGFKLQNLYVHSYQTNFQIHENVQLYAEHEENKYYLFCDDGKLEDFLDNPVHEKALGIYMTPKARDYGKQKLFKNALI